MYAKTSHKKGIFADEKQYGMKIFKMIVLLCTVNLYAQKAVNVEIEKRIDQFSNTIYSNPSQALSYIQQATRLSKKAKNNFLSSRCLYNLGFYYYWQGKSKISKRYIYEAIPFAISSKNYKIIVLAYNQLAVIDREEGNYSASLKKLLYALDIAKTNQLSKNECFILGNLGALFEMQKDTLKALRYYKQNQDIAIQNDFKDVLLTVYVEIALLERKKDKNKAILDLQKAQILAIALNNKYEQFNILINLSAVYLSLPQDKGVETALNCLEQAKQIAIALKTDDNLFYVYFNLGGYFVHNKQYESAIVNYQQALQYYRKGVNEDQYINLLEALSDCNKKAGNFEQAFYYKEKFNRKKDSLFSVAKSKAFNEIQTRYEVEKKNLKIKLLTNEKQIALALKRQYLYIGIGLVFALFGLWIFFRHRIKTQKIIQEKEKRLFEQEKISLEQQQEIIQIKSFVKGQDQERNRIAQEIHDGIGGKLAGIKHALAAENETVQNLKIQNNIEHLTHVFQELRLLSHDLNNHLIKSKNSKYCWLSY